MIYRIHFGKDDWEDYVDIEGDTIDEIRENVENWLNSRNIDTTSFNVWSEQIRE